MLVATNLNKSYGNLSVLKDVNISVPAGTLAAIVGPSGAGKSTLLQLLGTLDKPDSGSISVNGTNLLALKGNALSTFRNQNIGFIFQFHNLLPEFSALENVCLPGYIGNKDWLSVQKRATSLLTALGLGNRLTHKPAALSGGEAQRVAVARALINDPAMVLADEPTGNLDSGTADQLLDLFLALRAQTQATFIIVTHNPALADRCDSTFRMTDGCLTEEIKML